VPIVDHKNTNQHALSMLQLHNFELNHALIHIQIHKM